MARRFPLSILALFLALLVGSGAALPSPSLWQCHHSSQLITAPFAAPRTMPCLMGGRSMAMGTMSCCAVRKMSAARNSHPVPTVAPASCHPIFTPLATISVASLGESQHSSQQWLTVADVLPFPIDSVMTVFVTTATRQRPPPDSHLLYSDRLHVPGLRAPPAA